MPFIAISQTQLDQFIFVLIVSVAIGMTLAWLIRNRQKFHWAMIINPLSLLGALIVFRLCLIGSQLVYNALIVAGVCFVTIAEVIWIFVLFREAPTANKQSHEPGGLFFNTLFQTLLLLVSRDFLVLGSEPTCWIWIIHVGVIIALASTLLFHGMRKRFYQWNPEKSIGELSVMVCLWISATCCLTGLMRTAYTEYHGSSEPGDRWERNHYQTTIKVSLLREDGPSNETDLQAEALAVVINSGISWWRWREVQMKSVSFVKGHPRRVKDQDDRLFPQEGATSTIVRIDQGASFMLSLTDDEERKFRK